MVCCLVRCLFFFFKQKTAYEIMPSLVGSEMCIRDSASSGRRATSFWDRSRGLLGRKGLEPGGGLLIDPCSGIHTFFMAFPIDAIFVDKEGTIVHLVKEIAPQRMSRYVFKARAVLCLLYTSDAADDLLCVDLG